jgi:hypothetical protein
MDDSVKSAGQASAEEVDDAVTEVARMLSEWEDSGELTTAFAYRVVQRVRQIDRKRD